MRYFEVSVIGELKAILFVGRPPMGANFVSGGQSFQEASRVCPLYKPTQFLGQGRTAQHYYVTWQACRPTKVLNYNYSMPDYRRYYISGFPVFITSVTQNRKQFFKDKENLDLFWKSVEMVKDNHLFDLLAYVVLPDHFHWLIKMPESHPNFSKVILSLKWNFTLKIILTINYPIILIFMP